MRVALLAAAPLAAIAFTPALADPKPTQTAEVSRNLDETKEDAQAKEAKRICRRIRIDASSRRKTKVCLTSEQWRQANQQR